MNTRTTIRAITTAVVTTTLLAFGSPSASAQEQGAEVGVTLRGTMLRASADGDVLNVATRHLTLDRGSLDAVMGALEVSVRPGIANRRLDLLAGVEIGGSDSNSVSVGDSPSGDPVAQQTSLDRGPAVYAGARLRLLPPDGRRLNVVLTGAGGVAQYELRQEGSFLDYRDGHAFNATYQTDGTYGFALLGGGVEVALGSRTHLLTDVRVRAGSAAPQGDYGEFGRLDLGGTQFSIGVTRMF